MSYLTADRMTQKELEGEIASIMQKAREGTVTARDASRLLDLKSALNQIRKITEPYPQLNDAWLAVNDPLK